MENQEIKHLSYFKVERFKGLNSLQLNDLQKVNIFLGDNNVGKTSVLEALLYDELPSRLLRNLYNTMSVKGLKTENPEDYFKNLGLFFRSKNGLQEIKYEFAYSNATIKKSTFSLVDTNGISSETINNLTKNTLVNTNDLPEKIVELNFSGEQNFYTLDINLHRVRSTPVLGYFPFIKSGLSYQEDLVQYFSTTVNNNLNLKSEFVSNLRFLSDEIADITIDTTTVPNTPILLVLFKNDIQPIPLFMMGDGVIRLVRIILEIMVCKNSRLMIDEIDNGIHFSKMKMLWRIVLKTSIESNTQLFITTHDSECLRAFKEVLEEDIELNQLQNEVASYTLFRNKEGNVDVVRYNFEEFEHAIDHSINIRG